MSLQPITMTKLPKKKFKVNGKKKKKLSLEETFFYHFLHDCFRFLIDVLKNPVGLVIQIFYYFVRV